MSTPQFRKLSKGVSKIVLKFPHKNIFHTRNCGILVLAFLFFVMVFWKSLSTWSLAANLDDLGVPIPFLLAMWKQQK
jgi:TM2 domain-containing membrane protein YozV